MVRFKPPKISTASYNALNGPEFDDLCKKVAKENRPWMKEIMPDPNTSWVLVIGNKAAAFGQSDLIPSLSQVREKCGAGQRGYLLMRPNARYCDLVLYFQSSQAKKIAGILKRNPADIKTYLEPTENISYVNAPSGVLNKLDDAFALGEIKYERPLLYPDTESKEKHAQGAYVAAIKHKTFGKPIRLTSQSLIEVNLRGSKTLDQRYPEKWVRMERLHRFHDEIVDMLNTYEVKKQENWPPLVLHRSRNSVESKVL
ncbi:MAG: hypothetical protein Q7J54_03775 [Candidatus Woesearchaeota archaeon]|nr:hypothetical protein [Candidatus Woesearchaeota archaeon]